MIFQESSNGVDTTFSDQERTTEAPSALPHFWNLLLRRKTGNGLFKVTKVAPAHTLEVKRCAGKRLREGLCGVDRPLSQLSTRDPSCASSFHRRRDARVIHHPSSTWPPMGFLFLIYPRTGNTERATSFRLPRILSCAAE